ncbi:MAG: CBS domain-containing protein [Candidatus Altiarchaeota archaeon]|nr:CBS domain-containing protein [Candidatus Altiarchaeota archaeon]
MQIPELGSIEKIRKKLGMTQTQLAEKAKVSQSLVARVESGSVDPRYSRVVRIFQALYESKSQAICARELMTKTVVSVKTTDSLGEAIKKMKRYKVSQLPVFKARSQEGSISEGVILDQISKGANISNLSSKKVGEYMEDPLPQVNSSTNINTISSLLEHNKAVLISEKGRIEGIVAKSDLLKVVRG